MGNEKPEKIRRKATRRALEVLWLIKHIPEPETAAEIHLRMCALSHCEENFPSIFDIEDDLQLLAEMGFLDSEGSEVDREYRYCDQWEDQAPGWSVRKVSERTGDTEVLWTGLSRNQVMLRFLAWEDDKSFLIPVPHSMRDTKLTYEKVKNNEDNLERRRRARMERSNWTASSPTD